MVVVVVVVVVVVAAAAVVAVVAAVDDAGSVVAGVDRRHPELECSVLNALLWIPQIWKNKKYAIINVSDNYYK